jgi:triosephosphate isomerase
MSRRKIIAGNWKMNKNFRGSSGPGERTETIGCK